MGLKKTTSHRLEPDTRAYLSLRAANYTGGQSGVITEALRLHALLSDVASFSEHFPDLLPKRTDLLKAAKGYRFEDPFSE